MMCFRSTLQRFVIGFIGASIGCLTALSQSTMPATEPTRVTSVSDLPSARPALSAGESRVTWNGASLTVNASGDELRSILGKVSRATGMRVTGGIPEERVFGTYGPGSAQAVLTELLDGLSVNMLLVNSTPQKPKELVLTARTGGPTPPSSRPMNEDDGVQQQVYPAFRSNTNGPPAQGNQQPPPPQQQQVPSAASPAFAMPAAPGQNPNDTTGSSSGTDANGTPQSPNGVRTPEQIFQELQQRQRRGGATQAPQ